MFLSSLLEQLGDFYHSVRWCRCDAGRFRRAVVAALDSGTATEW